MTALDDLTVDELRQIVWEYDKWEKFAHIPDDALIRKLAERYGETPLFSMYAASAEAFRELLSRMGLQELPEPKYILVLARVYPEDAFVNDVEDTDGNMPFLEREVWRIFIDIETGAVQGWPKGTTARTHYKVCDRANYHLCDDVGVRIADYRDEYVPEWLQVRENGYGDCIYIDIGEDGIIKDWKAPSLEDTEWLFLK